MFAAFAAGLNSAAEAWMFGKSFTLAALFLLASCGSDGGGAARVPGGGGVGGVGGPGTGGEGGLETGGEGGLGTGGSGGSGGVGGLAGEGGAGGSGGSGGEGGSPVLLPDLSVDEGLLASSVEIRTKDIPADSCTLEEACVGGTGLRRLVAFTTSTTNLGTADLVVGSPADNPLLQYSPCHGHHHFQGYADYRLLDSAGNVAARGHKQAFCLMDTQQIDPTSLGSGYSCDYQGLSRGWRDSYPADLDCQWIDATGLVPGQYTVEVEVNPEGVIAELDDTNNVARAPFYLPADETCVPSEELCFNRLDEDCDGTPDDGCVISGNDSCATAAPLDADGTYVAAVGANGVESSCAPGSSDTVFTFEVEEESLVYLSTFGSSFSTALSVRPADCGSEAFCEAAGSCGTAQQQWAGRLGAGRWIVVVESLEPAGSGTVQLKLQRSSCLVDRLESGVPVAGNTTGLGDHRATCGGGSGPEQSWFFTTCPGVAALTASTCDEGTTFDTSLAILEGSCTGLVVGCNDDTSRSRSCSTLEPFALAGDGLWFAVVDGFQWFDDGAYVLRATW